MIIQLNDDIVAADAHFNVSNSVEHWFIRTFGAGGFSAVDEWSCIGSRLLITPHGAPALQEVEAGTTVHLPLDQLEAVELTFDRPVAPGLCDRRPYGVNILAQAGSKAA